jgi:putative FmdB family regulatory protein
MPTYQYRCTECGHDLEAVQKFSDATLTECPNCGGRLRKVFNAVGVVFKGSGFYRNDSRSAATADKANGSSDTKAAPAESTNGSSSDNGSKTAAASSSSSSTTSSSGGSGSAGSSAGSSSGGAKAGAAAS